MISELYRSTMLTFREIYIRCWNFYRKYFDNSVYLYNYTLNFCAKWLSSLRMSIYIFKAILYALKILNKYLNFNSILRRLSKALKSTHVKLTLLHLLH